MKSPRETSCSALFVGAHPDDIEIGCGGTLAKMARAGWDVWVCVLTDESAPDVARARRDEARAGALACGVPPAHVLFVGAPDEHLRFAVLNLAALQTCQSLQFAPDIAHVNGLDPAHPLLIGTALRHSTTTKATSNAAPAASVATMRGFPKPSADDSISA